MTLFHYFAQGSPDWRRRIHSTVAIADEKKRERDRDRGKPVSEGAVHDRCNEGDEDDAAGREHAS